MVDAEAPLLSPQKLGLLDSSEYSRFRSPRLVENPQASLNEHAEIKDYLGNQRPDYLRELDQIDKKIDRPMKQECRVAITIPAFQEGQNIKHTLESFLDQKDKNSQPLNNNLFEIVLIENHKDSIAADETEAEVKKFMKEHPDVQVSYAHKAWGKEDAACVGNARRYAADLAVKRSFDRKEQNGDLLIVSFDGDIEGINEQFVANYINAFDTDARLDAAAGKWKLPEVMKSKKTLAAVQRFRYILDRVIQNDLFSKYTNKNPGVPAMFGMNSAFRASVYAAIGGYNEYADVAEDLEVGWKIASARQGDLSRFKYLNNAEIVTNPRRFLSSYVQNVKQIDMYNDFNENHDLRKMDNKELMKQVPDEFDRNRFEEEINALFGAYGNRWNGDTLLRYFNMTMNMLGGSMTTEKFHDTENKPHNLVRVTDVSGMLSSTPVNLEYFIKLRNRLIDKYTQNSDGQESRKVLDLMSRLEQKAA